jgi:hypothetical protein
MMDLRDHQLLKATVATILRHPEAFGGAWSLQGLGMLRLYLNPSLRLHVWSTKHAVDNVSEIHTHPWHFRSTIVAGKLTNVLYETSVNNGIPTMEQRLQCGAGGCLKDQPREVFLIPSCDSVYNEGASYNQHAEDIHASHPEDGTVTIIERTIAADPDHAFVYWPAGQKWVSAEPRTASREEIQQITSNALAKWF